MSVPQRQVRLPHLAKLRVKSALPKKTGGPCNVTLTNLLSCWASNAQGAPVCAGLEQELKACMATRVSHPSDFFIYFFFYSCFYGFWKHSNNCSFVDNSKSKEVNHQLPRCSVAKQDQPSSPRLNTKHPIYQYLRLQCHQLHLFFKTFSMPTWL